VVSLEEADEVADGAMSVSRVAEREFAVDVVVVAAAVALLGQVSGAFEVADDLRDRALGEPDLRSAERRHVRKEQVTLDWTLTWKDGELNVTVSGRPDQRSFQAFVVVEEGIASGEPLGGPEQLHTPCVAEIVNQLVLIPEDFFAKERADLERGERIWNDVLRRFSESAELEPEDPIVAAVFEGRDALAESRSTSTLADIQQRRLGAAREHNAAIFEAAMGAATAT
jgi:hypothetical protein